MSDAAITTHRPEDANELGRLVRSANRLVPKGGGSKPALSQAEEADIVDTRRLTGIVDYQPAEFTFTAHAGTTLTEVIAALAEEGQHLPFDPPLAEAGATLGGTVAAGLSGPGRVRHGGVRDFLLAVAWVDGEGELRRGGAPVVKNAAGFDVPKLMVGSLGRLGILTELTLKVFPQPADYLTGRFECSDLTAARRALGALTSRPFDLDALELQPPHHILVRLGGPTASLRGRLGRLTAVLGEPTEILQGEEERSLWRDSRNFSWASSKEVLVKVPITLGRLETVDVLAEDLEADRWYSAGGAVAWLALPSGRLEELGQRLLKHQLAGLSLRADPSPLGGPLLGRPIGNAFLNRLRGVLDPQGRFLPFCPGAS